MYKLTIELTERQKKILEEQTEEENKTKKAILVEGLILRHYIKKELNKPGRNLSITEKKKTIKDIVLL